MNRPDRPPPRESAAVTALPGWRAVFGARGIRALMVVEVAVALAVAIALWGLHRQMSNAELRMLDSLSAAMATQAQGTLELAETALRATRDELDQGLLGRGDATLYRVLRARVAALPKFRALAVFDAQGQVVASSGALSLSPESVRRSDYFAQAQSGTGALMYVGAVRPGPGASETSVGLSLDRRGAQGDFLGAVVLFMDPEVLDGRFDQIAPSRDTALAVYRGDRSLVSDGPGDGTDRLLPYEVVDALWRGATHVHPHRIAAPGLRPRLLAAHRVGRYPLLVVVTRDAAAALDEWRDLAWLTGSFALSALAMTLVLALRTTREQVRQRRLEIQLEQARRLEGLGTLAGGVAHDFNNILSAVLGYTELARDRPADARQLRHLDQVLQAAQRGKALVARILSFRRDAPLVLRRLRLQPVVEEVLDLLAATLPASIAIRRDLGAPDATLMGDATLLHEAAMNLCVNALQAMPAGGTLRVSLETIATTDPLALLEGELAPGRYVRLRISDTGVGIAPGVAEHLFEPFFTTKGGQGTGLGLAVVRSVVRELDGGIGLESEVGSGSTFSLYFPCVDPDPGGTPDEKRAIPRGRGQTVLVVDDEPALVELAEELLASLGYEPVGFSSSAAALAAFRAEPDRFDAVLSDELMPEPSGTAMAASMHELRPRLPVVVVSGYGGPRLEARGQRAGVRLMARKPLERESLARLMARALNGYG